MKLVNTKKVFVIGENPFLQFDVVEALGLTLPREVSELLRAINRAIFSEALAKNPALLNRYC